MAIPAGGLTVANLDAGTDRPDLARTEILAAVQKINEMLAKLPLYADGEQNGTGTQRVGLLKVGPEAAVPWASATRAVDIGSGSSIFQTSAGATGIAKNLYTDDDGTTWRYRAVGTAQLIWLSGGGGTSVYNAPSAGGAGTVATITGRLDVSTTGAVTFGANTAWHSGAPNEYANHPVSGYVRVGTGVYRRNTAYSVTNAIHDTLTAVAAPAGAKGLILSFIMSCVNANAVGLRQAYLYVYADAAGTIQVGEARHASYEHVAIASPGSTVLGWSIVEFIAPVISGSAYIKSNLINGNAQYAILGYTV